MNKKVLTLCAGFLLAGNAVAFATVFGGSTSGAVAPTTGYTIQNATFTTEGVISADESDAVDNLRFPTVSPFPVNTTYGAKPIAELKHVNGDIAEDQYFQFVVSGDPQGNGHEGKEVLTMVWVNDTNNQGHYELQVENVLNANIRSNRILLDRTLWKVTAKKETSGAGNTLYYTLQNKATDAILQLSISSAKDVAITGVDAKEVELKIVAGQTQWRWAEGERAATTSRNDLGKEVLKNQFSAQFSNGTTLFLVKKTDTNGNSKLTGLLLNSNLGFGPAYSQLTATNGDKYQYVEFEGWEANPIILTADQINSELGAETLNGGQDSKSFKFTFDPGVVGSTNIMTDDGITFEAISADAIEGKNRVPGDAADGFVRFQKKGTSEFLMVDTTYYNEAAQDRYELKMAVQEITFPRAAVLKDQTTIEELNTKKSNKTLYDAVSYSAAAYVQLMRQSNFRPIFYPATQTLKLQAEMIYKKAKNDEPWWYQVRHDIATSGYLDIAAYALDNSKNPLSTDAISGEVNAVGYYPAYVDATTSSNEIKARALAYNSAFSSSSSSNGYNKFGAEYRTGQDVWNAVTNLKVQDVISDGGGINQRDVPFYNSVGDGIYSQMLVRDPANAATDADMKTIWSPLYVQANSNVVKLVTLSSNEKFLSTDIADPNDATYNGLLTNISIEGLRQNSDIPAAANIKEGYYYIQNANEEDSQIAGVGAYRYEDLAATNAMFAYWNQNTQKWDRGVSGDGDGAKAGDKTVTTLGDVIKDNTGINEGLHSADNANVGNLVYSDKKLAIPSAQWYIKGDGNHYVMINRESGRQWNTEYWWATDEPGVYINQATRTNSAGQSETYYDKIRLTEVPAAELNDPYMGYLNLSQAECQNDTTVYNIGMTSMNTTRFSLSSVDGVLTMTPDSTGAYKLERALVKDVDKYVNTNNEHYADELVYGYVRPDANDPTAVDTMQMLKRAKYYIYKDEVSANSGIEDESIKTRSYITLSNGKYRLQDVKVQFNKVENGNDVEDNDLYSFNLDVEEVPGTENVKYRRAFYIKQITPDANQFVLVDPEVVSTTDNNTTGKPAYGARVFVNQLTAELQPGNLISGGYASSYANSILDFEKVGKQNYADIRGGEDRMNAKFFVEGDNTWLLGENGAVKGSNVGLLELRKQDADICNSIFVDTANVHDAAFPRFLLAVRNVDSTEVSNIPNHNHHILTKGAYLVNMIDSAATNNVYKYVNRDFNNTEWYRLGFVNATHQGDSLTIDNTKTVFDLSTEGLDKTGGLNYATFAFRYVDTERDNFYIETAYKDATKGWVKIHNGVAVVTPDIQEAEVFSFETTDEYATANETIAAEGAVSVVATDGAVIVKGAEGKNVVVATILGKVVANETINSDNETIAVPAGIAVVSVDGESFKVVVK
ncbi:hypothetical protein B5F77_09415 [Parabacteroides sp. An277]|uniref:DUF6383 domain-containing protein n=1 Tax=Parabacteroides sp. An277 TaxID=1965619 RepID=UPI000B3A9D29|nr:DUF6383 domain-containing protein [Parabacteroides sp. An277]OUO51945.1 hypothetical protein B5F77_09415 [Parabacteroides sp. An277]